MGIQVDYTGTTPEGIPFQGAYIKLSSFVADYNSGPTMTVLARFHAFVSRDARLDEMRPVSFTTIPTDLTFSFEYSELRGYSFGIIEFIYERYARKLVESGFTISQVLEENQTAPVS